MTLQQEKPARKPRLRRINCNGPGITRRRYGKGYSYRAADGSKITDAETVERINQLAIPPAWTEVHIAATAGAKVQAVGFDNHPGDQQNLTDFLKRGGKVAALLSKP